MQWTRLSVLLLGPHAVVLRRLRRLLPLALVDYLDHLVDPLVDVFGTHPFAVDELYVLVEVPDPLVCGLLWAVAEVLTLCSAETFFILAEESGGHPVPERGEGCVYRLEPAVEGYPAGLAGLLCAMLADVPREVRCQCLFATFAGSG